MKAIDIPGWMSPEELVWLRETGRERYVVEFGSWRGRSTAALAEHARRVWACDHWKGDGHPNGLHDQAIAGGLDVQAEFRKNLDPEISQGLVVPVTVDLADPGALTVIRRALGPVRPSVVFIDANHTAPHVENDIWLALEIVEPFGLVCGHDYDPREWPDVVDAVHRVFGRFARGPGFLWAAPADHGKR